MKRAVYITILSALLILPIYGTFAGDITSRFSPDSFGTNKPSFLISDQQENTSNESEPPTGIGNKEADPPIDPDTKIVVFENSESKSQFLKENNLDETKLEPISKNSKEYVVKTGDIESQVDGVKTYDNLRYSALLTPNDPIYPQWYTDKIKAPQAWDTTTGSSTITIAVIDTGFALNHEEMSGRWHLNSGENGSGKESNGVDDDGNGFVDDWRGWDFIYGDNDPIAGSNNPNGSGVSHGTHTAGLVAATGNNNKGVASINWAAKIIPLQALGDSGSGFTSDIAEAIEYAVDQGADIISMSLGQSGADSFLKSKLDYAKNNGVLVIAASGNDGCDCILYPANYPQVLAVGATTSTDARASFSSFGGNLDVVAPGSGTLRTPTWTASNGTSAYTDGNIHGTSYATPIVAGLAGLIKGQDATLTHDELANAITDQADKVSGMNGQTWHEKYGYGRINARAGLAAMTVAHPDGTLIKATGDNKVYLIENGQRRHIQGLAEFNSWNFDWDAVKVANVADLGLAIGDPLSFKEGSIIKGSTNAIYMVDYEGSTIRKRHISSWSVYVNSGLNELKRRDVSDSKLPDTNGPDIDSADAAHPDGVLVRNDSNGKVFQIEDGQRRHVKGLAEFNSWNFKWSQVLSANTADLALTEGSGVTFNEGSLIKASGPEVYAVNYSGANVEKRHISSLFKFNLLDYSGKEIIDVSDSKLPGADGTAI